MLAYVSMHIAYQDLIEKLFRKILKLIIEDQTSTQSKSFICFTRLYENSI